jgi:hypothetical protein
MNNAPLPNDIAGAVHWKYYGKSDKVNAPENRNREFQEGYCTGTGSLPAQASRNGSAASGQHAIS